MFLSLIAIVILASIIVVTTGAWLSAPKYRGDATDHFNGKTFFNPNGPPAKGVKELFKWLTNRQRGEWVEDTSRVFVPRPLLFEKENIRITFVNHSTFLIQVDGLNILTDPIWSERTSPFSWLGPKRMRAPGIRFEDLPRIDVVIISHNHYDHLDIPTMRTLAAAFHPIVVTPLGVKQFLDNEKIGNAADLDWWQETELKNGVRVQAVPAQHFSGRGMFDRDATLWCGYVVKTSRGNIYFAGDTGYNEVTFKEIGSRSGPMAVSLIPIGAYKPQWFMSPVHISPEEAVRVHLDVQSKLSIGMHYGTFPLADDGLNDPVDDLKLAKEKFVLDDDAFITLDEGAVHIVD